MLSRMAQSSFKTLHKMYVCIESDVEVYMGVCTCACMCV